MKTIIKIFICLSLIYTPMFVNAATVGGWNLSNAVAQGASTVYDATKNVVINGKDFVKNSWVKITPTASQVSKVLARGGAGYALSVAVEQLLGSVDWVLDPANNRIIYYENPVASQASCNQILDASGMGSEWQKNTRVTSISCGAITYHQTSNVSCSKITYTYKVSSVELKTNNAGNFCVSGELANEEEEKYLPLPVVAQKVISNAENGDTNAQVATTAAAADIVAEAEKDDAKARPIASQAEANAETKPADPDAAASANSGAATATPQADPVTGEQAPPTDISLEFPVFCNWAPTVCQAAQVVISFPQTLTGWWESANQKADDWATSISDAYRDFTKDDELPNDDTKVDITDIPTPELQENAISWGAACPADVSIPISMQGVSSTLVFSWSPWCQLLSIIKPAIITSAYIGAAFIVLGLRT